MNKIEEIASVHLGKAGDGSVVNPYITPDRIDASLLVGIPRHLNRTQYNIEEDNLPFEGTDSWNGYEFSCLLDNGFPVCGQVRWDYNSDSANIVESKSAKLYLNSYNMMMLGPTVKEAISNAEDQIAEDMASVLGLKDKFDINVVIHTNEDHLSKPVGGYYAPLEEIVDVENIKFDAFNENPDILDIVRSNHSQVFRLSSKSLRSNCRVTNQPDWGDVYIHIKGLNSVSSTSLLKYIVSMRKENHFHEEICECIYKRLYDLLDPEELMVVCLYTRRGGIDINPVRASNKELLYSVPIADSFNLPLKTMRQ